ncbi:formylglycine-generating enzyme family protein [Polaribacter sp. L3A8]|uniref:formylglycine-generating enzyme family protein n=1 Tax=Polaribacter sp. L3A8 TaxID=2686361 RepID=UPI00131C07B6|nr:SUMF1/EgtB/PvdO family nonheme iron enzyme [Polaribacter sp. L3A8]
MKKTITFLTIMMMCFTGYANNIRISNISLENLNEAGGWVHVEFDLAWDNSWRLSAGPSNWDAAWVFVKYRTNNGNWTHATVYQANSVAATGSTLEVSNDNKGAFIYRDADGDGNVNFTNIQLQWDYGSTNTSDILDVQVYAIEMVHVPEGPFALGGTVGTEKNKFHRGGVSTTLSYNVTSENAITIANTAGNLYYTSEAGTAGDQTGILPLDYPKGFGAFYCMKYETSEAQWVAFFNTLTEQQKGYHDLTDADHKNSDATVIRNTISWTGGTADATTTSPDRALAYLHANDVNAYMDWAAMRPMTELEYEKAARGPIAPNAGEFAWGNANINNIDYTLSNSGFSTEIVNNPAISSGNALYLDTRGSIIGPVRCGIFASSAVNKTREETGGSYYGIMELSGNVYESVVTVGTAQGRSFIGTHGNGIVNSTTGNGTVSDWPNSTTGDGYGYRGGSYVNGADFLRISDRFDGATLLNRGSSRIGFRAVRTAP